MDAGHADAGAKRSAGEIRQHADEPVHRQLVSVDRAEQLLHLRGWRLQRRELGRELVHRQHLLVARPVIRRHRLVEGAPTGKGLVESGGAQLGVAEGVGDALGRDGRPVPLDRCAMNDVLTECKGD
jgi:hypothetical protein